VVPPCNNASKQRDMFPCYGAHFTQPARKSLGQDIESSVNGDHSPQRVPSIKVFVSCFIPARIILNPNLPSRYSCIALAPELCWRVRVADGINAELFTSPSVTSLRFDGTFHYHGGRFLLPARRARREIVSIQTSCLKQCLVRFGVQSRGMRGRRSFAQEA
jgi:hypothetical protein